MKIKNGMVFTLKHDNTITCILDGLTCAGVWSVCIYENNEFTRRFDMMETIIINGISNGSYIVKE